MFARIKSVQFVSNVVSVHYQITVVLYCVEAVFCESVNYWCHAEEELLFYLRVREEKDWKKLFCSWPISARDPPLV